MAIAETEVQHFWPSQTESATSAENSRQKCNTFGFRQKLVLGLQKRLKEASTGTRLNWPAKPCFRYLALTKHLSFPGIYPLLTLVDASLILSSQRRSVNTYILYVWEGPPPAESQNKRQPSVNRVYKYTNVQVLYIALPFVLYELPFRTFLGLSLIHI